MKNFKFILNRLALFESKAQKNINLNDNSPCCKAAYFNSRTSVSMQRVANLYANYLKGLGGSPRYPNENYRQFKSMFLAYMLYAFKDFIANYCSCQNLNAPFSSDEYGPSTDYDPIDNETILPGLIVSTPVVEYNSSATEACKSKLEQDLRDFSSLAEIPTPNDGPITEFDGLNLYDSEAITNAYSKYISRLMLLFNFNILNDTDNENFIVPRTDTLKNFLDDTCRMRPEQTSLAIEAVRDSADSDSSITKILDELLSRSRLSDAEDLFVSCPPSANDNTIGALAAALGVSAAVVAVALAALRRGKTKQCSDVAVTARNLTPLLIAATGASFAPTQTSEATVQERLQAVLQKDCEGRLPYSCGEGGFEGPDGGDAGGEVDAPGGGAGVGGG